MGSTLVTQYKGGILTEQNLPSLPNALHELERLAEDPNASTEQMAKIISRDQALAAKVLKMVNSPVYGFPGRIVNVQHAIVLLGINVIRSLIISTVVFDEMNKAMVGLWEHSVGCSIACTSIVNVLGLKNPEEYAVLGLLHDIGKMVFSLQLPAAKEEVLNMVKTSDMTFREAEKKILGFTHDHINGWLCEQWNLPLMVRDAIVNHHNPLSAQFYPEAACVVHLGDFFTRLFEIGNGGDDNVPTIDPHALRKLGVNNSTINLFMDDLKDKLVPGLDLLAV